MADGYNHSPPELGSLKIRVGATTQGPQPTASFQPNVLPSIAAFAAALQQVSVAQQNNTGPIEFSKFISYEYDESFLTPSDASTFVLADDELTTQQRAALACGTRVEVSIDDRVQSISYITKLRTRSSRGTGTLVTVECMDWLNRAVKGHVDPNTRFKPSMTLEDLLTAVFEPFGMQVLATDNAANRNAITGAVYGTPTSKKGKPLKSFILHQIKPNPQEGAFAFAARVSQRFGLWLWPAVDGSTVIVGKPDFDQDSRYQLHHTLDSTAKQNNVTDSDVEVSDEEQPNILFASGFGGGGEFAKSRLHAGIINPLVQPPANSLAEITNAYPNVPFVLPPVPAIASGLATFPILNPNAVPLYLYDPESHTQDQLNAFVQRELSLRMRKSLVAHYTFEGHTLGGQPVAVDTLVDVHDDRARLNLPLWVLSRKFHKAGHGAGTYTTVELIRPGSLTF